MRPIRDGDLARNVPAGKDIRSGARHDREAESIEEASWGLGAGSGCGGGDVSGKGGIWVRIWLAVRSRQCLGLGSGARVKPMWESPLRHRLLQESTLGMLRVVGARD